MDDRDEYEIRRRAAEALADRDQVREALRQRMAGDQGPTATEDPGQVHVPEQPWKWPTREFIEPIKPPAAPRQRAAYRDWPAEAIREIADQRITERLRPALNKFAEDVADATLEHLQWRFTRSRQLTNERVEGVEARLTRSEEATLQLITELEQRIDALEQRLEQARAMPRLVPNVA